MLPDGGPGGQEKCDQRKGENRKGNKAKKRKQGRTEEKRRKKKNAPTESGGVPWHTMCPVNFAPTVPAPGRFLFRFFIPYAGFSSFTRFRFSFRFLPPLRHRPDPCVTRIGISMYRCGCIATSRCTDIRVSASRYAICCSAAAPGKSFERRKPHCEGNPRKHTRRSQRNESYGKRRPGKR